jgi:glycosyltransferase involved in cell wall biosynthesis
MVYYSRAGIGQYTLQLTQALSKITQGDEFILLQSYKDRGSLVDHPSFHRRTLYTPSHHRLEQLTLPLELALVDQDLLHSPDFIPPFRCRCKSVITIHDLAFLLFPNLLTRESARYYGQIDLAVRRADHIIAVSESTKRDIVRLVGAPERKLSVVYEAANPIFRPLEEAEATAWVQRRYSIPGDFVLFVSTIEPKKNLPTLLQAFRKLLDSYHPKVKLVVAGDRGWLFEEVFDAVSKLGLTDEVAFLGRVSSEELLHLYNAARVLVHPALYEGFGLTPLEAMACGTPVIVSNVSSLPEVVGDAGLLVEPKDIEGFAVAMWRILDNPPLRKELREKGLQRAKNFSWEKTARETLALYHRLERERKQARW